MPGRRPPLWDLLTSRGQVLAALAQDPTVSAAQIARQTGYSGRQAFNALRDLEAAGLISAQRRGRGRLRTLMRDAPVELLPGVTVPLDALLTALGAPGVD